MPALLSYTAKSTEHLGFALLAGLGQAQPNNMCISPLSISLCLQLALCGAYGETAAEMLRATGITAGNAQIMADEARSLIAALLAPPKHSSWEGEGAVLKFSLANSVWVHNSARLNNAFADGLANFYSAECMSLNFADHQSVNVINRWVERQTEQRIPTVISRLVPEQMVVLINAAYFKARWQTQFRPEDTKPGEFHLASGSTVQTEMMQRSNMLIDYYKGDTVEVAQLDYTDERYSMFIVLPEPNIDLNSLLANLSAERWNSWLAGLREHLGPFAMPKFKTEFFAELSSGLQHLGMQEAFSPSADFRNMLASDQAKPPFFCIGQVVHRTFVEVDEQGTEAAAATAITMWGAGIPAPPPLFQMIVDRPFLYAVRENTTGAILFIGTVFDPRG